MQTDKKVAFLVDFDNVATDVIEQALNAVFKDYGAAHIRRAYCNAEQAQHQQAFLKRLGLRAIVNLAIGKNSTDIAMAVDAMELAISEKPDVIVLVSSDSDFAPLVLRLREKGAWLRGFGQYGKTGDGVIQIYDQFNELVHDSKATSKPSARGTSSRGTSRKRAEPRAAAPRAAEPRVATPRAAEPRAAEPRAAAPRAAEVKAVEPQVIEAQAQAPAPKVAEPKRAPAAKKRASKAEQKPAPAGAPATAAAPASARATPAPAPARTAPAPAPAPDAKVLAAREINAILDAFPSLGDLKWHDLGAAAKALREAGLLAKTAPSTKLFRKHPHAFELQPAKQPNQVRFGHG